MNQAEHKVLIVDDEPINIRVLAQSLSKRYHIKTATSGEKALEIAVSDDPPDLILLDILLPNMDGYEVCRRLKHDARSKDIPVIFITGKDSPEDEAKGLELGAVDYILKPFRLPIIMARVKNHLELKKKNDLLEQLVFIDGLTEIPNRRRFDELFETEWLRARRASHPLTVVLLDIDHFKDFNDHYGHAFGDECLRRVAATLSEALQRPSDFIARYGGEEFVAVLPEADLAAAQLIAEKMRAAVEQLAIPHQHSAASPVVTVSLGAATTLPSESKQPDKLLESADKALYRAKAEGRNRAVMTDFDN